MSTEKGKHVKAGDRIAPFEPYTHTEASAAKWNAEQEAREAAEAPKTGTRVSFVRRLTAASEDVPADPGPPPADSTPATPSSLEGLTSAVEAAAAVYETAKANALESAARATADLHALNDAATAFHKAISEEIATLQGLDPH